MHGVLAFCFLTISNLSWMDPMHFFRCPKSLHCPLILLKTFISGAILIGLMFITWVYWFIFITLYDQIWDKVDIKSLVPIL